MEELWKDIKGFEGKYKISSNGKVYSIKRKIYKIPDKTNSGGYLRVQLSNDKSSRKYFIHRLVAEAFVAGYFEGANVNHKDFNRQNNNADNLEWVTKSQNSKWTAIHGRMTGAFKDKPYMLKYKDRELKFKNIKECARFLGVCKSSLYNKIRDCNGYLKRFNCFILPCVSNDYSERKYNQAIGNGSNRC